MLTAVDEKEYRTTEDANLTSNVVDVSREQLRREAKLRALRIEARQRLAQTIRDANNTNYAPVMDEVSTEEFRERIVGL